MEEKKTEINLEDLWYNFSGELKKFINKRISRKEDAEDILQDIYIKILKNIHTLKDEEKLQSWIFRISANAVNDYYRHRKPMLQFSDPLEIPDINEQEMPENMNNEFAKCLKPMVDTLPAKYREALVLADLEGLPRRELADRLNLSVPGAKSRVQRGRGMLKEILLACCTFEFDRYGNILEYEQKKDNSCP